MKNLNKIYLVFIFFAFNSSCKKNTPTTSTVEKNQTTQSSSLEDTWWNNTNRAEHIYFATNGRFFYIKGNNYPLDSLYSGSKGNWKWLNGDTLFINQEGVLQGTCVKKKLVQDTLIMDFNVKSTYFTPNNDIWIK